MSICQWRVVMKSKAGGVLKGKARYSRDEAEEDMWNLAREFAPKMRLSHYEVREVGDWHCEGHEVLPICTYDPSGEDDCPHGNDPVDCKDCFDAFRRDTCPHGNSYADCDACFIAGDLAFDAARERGR